MDKAKRGDVIYVDRGLYYHFGVYENPQSIIHYAPVGKDKAKLGIGSNPVIHITTLKDFLDGAQSYVICEFSVLWYKLFSQEETIKRARSKVGEREYSLALNNCEHFATWCKTGKNESYQGLRLFGVQEKKVSLHAQE